MTQADLVKSLDLPDLGLAANDTGGPLVAVVGVVGGSGTSTLAYTLAVAAALESAAPVVVADTGGPLASIGRLALVPRNEQRTLEGLSRGLETGHAAVDPYAVDRFGVRVLGGAPAPDDAPLRAVGELLAQTKAANGLTVVDCGALTRALEWQALGVATHIVWVGGSTDAAIACGRARFDSLELVLPRVPSALVIICSAKSADKRRMRQLTALAVRRDANVVLWPPLEDIDDLPAPMIVAESVGTLKRLGSVIFA